MTQSHPLSMKTVPDLTTLKAAFPSVRTLLFDMDGTLFNTEEYHSQAMQNIGYEQKIIPPFGPHEIHEMLMGKADHLVFDLIKDWQGFPKHWDTHTFINEKNRHLLAILSKVEGSTYFSPRLKTLLIEATQEKFQIGLVTSSEKVVTLELLKLAGLGDFFTYVLTRDDTEFVKPDPWPYLTAMSHFKAAPESTLVFEDSKVGMEAAQKAGAHLIKAEWYL